MSYPNPATAEMCEPGEAHDLRGDRDGIEPAEGNEPDPGGLAPKRRRRDPLKLKWRSDRRVVGLLQDLFWPRPERPRSRSRPMSKSQIIEGLTTRRALSDAEAEALLDEARAIYETRDARLARIEARATTLQATVGIATALMLAAAGVVLDSNKVAAGWRDVLAVVLALLIISLVMCGWHATRAAIKPLERDRLRSRDAVERPRRTKSYGEALRSRATDLLAAANENAKIDFRRTALLPAARRWFFCALALILCIAVLLCVYTLFGEVPASSR